VVGNAGREQVCLPVVVKEIAFDRLILKYEKGRFRPTDDLHTAPPVEVSEEAVVDDEDYPLVAGFTWRAIKPHNVWYALCQKKYHGQVSCIYMHQVLNPVWPRTDHRDGDG